MNSSRNKRLGESATCSEAGCAEKIMRKLGSKTLILALSMSPAMAGELTIHPHEVLAVLTDEWTGDGRLDRAILVQGEDGFTDLLIYVVADDGMTLAAQSESIGWARQFQGMMPELALSPSGALQVITMNEAIGRNRWRETLTVVYRDDAFVVAGYTNNAYDTIDPDYAFDCDINLLTGKGIFNGKTFGSDVRAMPVTEWSAERYTPAVLCPGE
jgi:hypothetical protein